MKPRASSKLRAASRGPQAVRPRRPQLRTRVLVSVLTITLVALVAFDVAAVSGLRKYLLSQTDSQLHNVVALYRPMTITLPPGATPMSFRGHTVSSKTRAAVNFVRTPAAGGVRAQVSLVGPRLRLRPAILDQFFVEFASKHGPKLEIIGNPDLRPALQVTWDTAVAHPGWLVDRTVAGSNGRVPLRVLAVHEAGGTLVATTSLASVNRTVGRLELILIIGSAIAGLLVALGVAMIVRRGLRPIEAMATQADRITAGDLTERVSLHESQTEVGRLGTALNGMLGRIEASMAEREASQEATRQFFADASHELRTPLASLRANAELYLQGALTEADQVDQAMRRIAMEAQRMGGLVDDMLKLARLDQHPDEQRDLVDVTTLAAGCVERAQIADPERAWNTDIDPDLMLIGDEELLRRAIDNLVANVRAHTPSGTAATITAARQGDSVLVEVSDNGPGVPADLLPRIFDRFYRAGGQSQRPGSGLGLAIVSAVADAHNGTAEAAISYPHGLRVTLTLPVTGCSGDQDFDIPEWSGYGLDAEPVGVGRQERMAARP
jgi:two-component system, OmpR family, sensor kinase